MSTPEEKYCPYCGTMIPYLDEYCPACGKQLPVMPGMVASKEKPRKKVWIAVLSSLLITGLGQIYLGEWRKGISFFVGTFAMGFLLADYVEYSTIMMFGTIMAILSAYEAYKSVTK